MNTTFVGKEVALKLEENSWSAMSKVLDYQDVGRLNFIDKTLSGAVLVIASYQDRLDEAIHVMERLYNSGIDFVAVSYPNRKQSLIEKYSRKRCIFLPRLHWAIQAYVDLIFFYQFAFYYGLAHGRSIGIPPRNRAKSLTAVKSSLFKQRPAKAELDQIRQNNDTFQHRREFKELFQKESKWEHLAVSEHERRYYRQLRHLAAELSGENPLDVYFQYLPDAIEKLAFAMYADDSDFEEILFIPFDRCAEAVSRNLIALWRPFWEYSARSVPAPAVSGDIKETVLTIGLATKTPEPKLLKKCLKALSNSFVWFGPKLNSIQGGFIHENDVNFTFRKDTYVINGEVLYMGLSLVLSKIWQGISHEKGSIIAQHLQYSRHTIMNLLSHFELRQSIFESVNRNHKYETAFIVGPPTGNGIAWLECFDQYGKGVMEYHPYGASAHGPIVTVDSLVQHKFVKLQDRNQMIRQFGEDRVVDWEERYLKNNPIDNYLIEPRVERMSGYQRPFFVDNDWYFPELMPNYDTTQDNLIILDATNERFLSQALEEIATYICRYPRMIIITQETFQQELEKTSLFNYPISNLILLPTLKADDANMSISGFHLPFAVNLVARCMAAAYSHRNNTTKIKS